MRIGQILFSQLSNMPIKDYKSTGRYHGRDWQHFVDPKEGADSKESSKNETQKKIGNKAKTLVLKKKINKK